MSERKQAIKGVLAIDVVIRPVAVEATGGIPERIDKIKTSLRFLLIQAHLQCCQRMQGRGCGKQIRHRRIRYGHKTTLCMQPCP